MRSRLVPSVAGKHSQAAGWRQLPVPPQPVCVGVCLVAHACLPSSRWAGASLQIGGVATTVQRKVKGSLVTRG